jgi:signal transduction histidine kinase
MNAVELSSELESFCIKGNLGLFQQVLVNILKNGIEACFRVVLFVAAIEEKTMAKITITDNGVGIE